MRKRIYSGCLAVLMLLSMVVGFPVTAQAASTMTSSADLITVLKSMEGFSRYPYEDYGQISVGYGTACPADKVEEYRQNGIPDQDAEDLLAQALQRFEGAVNRFADRYDLNLKQHQFDALVSFSYNCGEGWMSETTGYFNTAVREGNDADFLYGICLYSTAGGEYILQRRRLCEANMYINGEYKAYNAYGDPEHLKYVFLDGNGGTTRYAIYGFDARQDQPVQVAFSHIPTGIDGEEKPFAYTLEGWYTADGQKVETLDHALSNGQILYARWADPEGQVVPLPKGRVENMTVTVTASRVNVRTGPATFYDKAGAYTNGTQITLTETYEVSGYTWGKTDLGWFRLDYSNYDDVKAAQSQFPKNGTVTGNDVNVRTGPGTGYSRAYRLNKGAQITITEEATGGSYRWGKMTDGNWICLDYVQYDENVKNIVTVMLVSPPDRTEYIQMTDPIRTEGSVLLVLYDDGTSSALSLTRSMVTDYDNETLGQTTVTATYEGHTVQFPVTIVKATVTFLDWDGSVLSQQQYAYGQEIQIPDSPTRQSQDPSYRYRFDGWDSAVVPCAGNATYRATYKQEYIDYLVKFIDWSGREISSNTYRYGDPVEIPADPTRQADETYTYAFAGWDVTPSATCVADATYKATYTPTYIDYTVRFVDWDGREISSQTYHYGDPVEIPADPTRQADGTYIYTFAGWDVTPAAICLADATYTATYTKAYTQTHITAGKVSGKLDEQVRLPVTVSANNGISAFTMAVDFPEDNLQFAGVEPGPVLHNGQLSAQQERGVWQVTWTGTEAVSDDGVLFYLLFTFKQETTERNIVTLWPEDLRNAEDQTIDCVMTDGQITLGNQLSGTITAQGDSTAEVTLKLFRGQEEVAATVSTDGTFCFRSVPAGTYTLQATKEKHGTRIYEITLNNEDVVQDLQLYLLGDIDLNTGVDSDDVVQLLLHISLPAIFPIETQADFTGDGAVTSDDVIQLLLHISLPGLFPLG